MVHPQQGSGGINMDERLAALRDRLAAAADIDVFRHALGLERLTDIPALADQVADDMIVVCLDCEHWSNNTEEMTEIGVVQFTMSDMVKVTSPQGGEPDLGDHGENLLKLVKFNPLRIKETSHLVSSYVFTLGAAGNRFGEWRYTSFKEAREILCKVFSRSMSGLGCNHPVVLLGQDVGHDKSNLKHKQLGLDLEALGTVVRTIDTQKMAKEVGYWHHSTDNIGLERLVSELWFEHSDPHTAANDAARTLISAVQFALRDHPCKGKCITKTMQQVATTIESHSRTTFTSLGGDRFYCAKCGSGFHADTACTVSDLNCAVCLEAGRIVEAGTHITLHCPQTAQDRCLARRERERLEKPAKERAKAEKKAEAARLKRQEVLQTRNSLSQGPVSPPQPSQVTYAVQYLTQYNYGPQGAPDAAAAVGPSGSSVPSYWNHATSSSPGFQNPPAPPHGNLFPSPQGFPLPSPRRSFESGYFSQPPGQRAGGQANVDMEPPPHPGLGGNYGVPYAGSAAPRGGIASRSRGRRGRNARSTSGREYHPGNT
ncbi:hypothetical protein J1614_003754 [Plenodomus biglobosus]|nr:hypothetical protein J1614_003754 [Plenodomus biglobosus]